MPLPDAIIPREPEPDPINERAKVVIACCNRYLRAILSGDRAAMDAAGREWDEL